MDRGPWYLVGPLMGLDIVGMLWATNRPLGALGGYVDLQTWMRRPAEKIGWRLFFVVGVVLGGLVATLVGGDAHVSLDYAVPGSTTAARMAVLVLAGVLMGYGARTAGGCTSGHGLSGSALASPASWVATGTFMATAVAVEHLIAWGVS